MINDPARRESVEEALRRTRDRISDLLDKEGDEYKKERYMLGSADALAMEMSALKKLNTLRDAHIASQQFQ